MTRPGVLLITWSVHVPIHAAWCLGDHRATHTTFLTAPVLTAATLLHFNALPQTREKMSYKLNRYLMVCLFGVIYVVE